MNTEYFHYLLTVAHYQSISRAADGLHLQRSYLSKVIQSVERELEVTLFVRGPRGVLVTEEGQAVLTKFQQVLDILEGIKEQKRAAKAAVYPQYHDELTLFSPQKLRPRKRSAQYLPAFQQRFPNVAINMIDLDVGQMITAVQERPLSVAFTMRSPQWSKLSEPIPDGLVFRHVADTPLVALAAPNNPIAQAYQSMTLATLLKQELVFIDAIIREEGVLRQLLSPYEPLHIRYSVSSLPLFYQLLRNNPYFSIGLYSDDVNDDLLQIPLRDNIYLEQGILYRQDSLQNIVGRYFIDLLLASYEEKTKGNDQ